MLTKILLPNEDNELAFRAIERKTNTVIERSTRLPRDIEMAITAVIVKEIELVKRLSILKRLLEMSVGYSPIVTFELIDILGNENISLVSLDTFFRKNGHNLEDNQLFSIIRRLNLKNRTKITY